MSTPQSPSQKHPTPGGNSPDSQSPSPSITLPNTRTASTATSYSPSTNGSELLPPEGTLKVIVGSPNSSESNNNVFTLPTSLLTSHSQYFSSLLAFPGSEQKLRTVTLDIDEIDHPTAFRCIVDFMEQKGRYEWIKYYDKHYHYKFQADPSSFGLILNARVYVLAERLLAPDVAKFALKELKEILDNTRFLKKPLAFFPSEGLLKATEVVYLGTPDRYFNTSSAGDHHETTLTRRSDWSKRVKNKYQENIRDIMASHIAKNIKAINMLEFGRSKTYLNLLMNVPELSIDISMAVYPEMYYVEQSRDSIIDYSQLGKKKKVQRAEPSRCKLCQRLYPSRNELFRHLKDSDHYVA